MKKLISFLSTLLLVCFAAAAFAEPYVSNLYKPIVPETLKALLGGKASMPASTGWNQPARMRTPNSGFRSPSVKEIVLTRQ